MLLSTNIVLGAITITAIKCCRFFVRAGIHCFALALLGASSMRQHQHSPCKSTCYYGMMHSALCGVQSIPTKRQGARGAPAAPANTLPGGSNTAQASLSSGPIGSASLLLPGCCHSGWIMLGWQLQGSGPTWGHRWGPAPKLGGQLAPLGVVRANLGSPPGSKQGSHSPRIPMPCLQAGGQDGESEGEPSFRGEGTTDGNSAAEGL